MTGSVVRFTAAERFWPKVSGGSVDECWEWQAARTPTGYGTFTVGGAPVRAHRWAYEALIAPIPAGLELDHLCRNTSCVNPWHLEPVTRSVNNLRARYGHCRKGHALVGDNIRSNGRSRCCLICNQEYKKRRYQAKRNEMDTATAEPGAA